MLLNRYKTGRNSSLSLYPRSKSSTVLSRLAYHTSKSQTLEPISSAKTTDTKTSQQDGPIDDIGVPTYLTTVNLVHQKHHKDIKVENLPNLPIEITQKDIPLLKKKLEICNLLCDFTDNDVDREAKAVKSATIKELFNVFGAKLVLDKLPKEIIDEFFVMIQKNIFRGIPMTPKKFLFYDDEPLIFDVNWPHLNLIYQLFFKYQNLRPADERFTIEFHRKMMKNLLAPDPNERDMMLQFFKDYVIAFPDRENMVWVELSFYLINYKENAIPPFAVMPILLFFNERFAETTCNTELSDKIFKDAIIPLISSKHILSFYGALTQMFEIFIARDQGIAFRLALQVILRFPVSKPSKQILFIRLLNFLTEKVTSSDFELLAKPLFTLYAYCSTLNNGKVVDASFQIWSNVQIIPMILDNTRIIYPILHPALTRTMKKHWSTSTQNQALNTLRNMHDIDPFMFDELNLGNPKKMMAFVEPDVTAATVAHKNWAIIARVAASKYSDFNLARILADIQMKFNKPVADKGPGSHKQKKKHIASQDTPKVVVPSVNGRKFV